MQVTIEDQPDANRFAHCSLREVHSFHRARACGLIPCWEGADNRFTVVNAALVELGAP
jgi:hypothetical protein